MENAPLQSEPKETLYIRAVVVWSLSETEPSRQLPWSEPKPPAKVLAEAEPGSWAWRNR